MAGTTSGRRRNNALQKTVILVAVVRKTKLWNLEKSLQIVKTSKGKDPAKRRSVAGRGAAAGASCMLKDLPRLLPTRTALLWSPFQGSVRALPGFYGLGFRAWACCKIQAQLKGRLVSGFKLRVGDSGTHCTILPSETTEEY